MASHRIAAILAGAALLAAGCQSVPMLPGIGPHKIDVQQGNVVTQEMVAKLKPGMTRQQVRFVLGTPPIVDPFRADRWDYVYFMNKRGNVVDQRRVTAVFEGDILKHLEGDVVAATEPGLKSEARSAAPAAKPPAAGTPGPESKGTSGGSDAPAKPKAEEKGFFGRMMERIGL